MNETSALAQAQARWKKAEAAVVNRALKVDAEWAFALLEKAREIPAWRGTLCLAGSVGLPWVPEWAGASDTPTLILFQLLGAVSLGAAVWFLAKDGARWGAWWRARRDLRACRYQSSALQKALELERLTDLEPLKKEDADWVQMQQWARHDKHLAGIWKQWNASGKPVRQGDLDVFREAVFALLELQDLKQKPLTPKSKGN